MPPPPRPSGGGARGPKGPPHSPPLPPTQAQERTEADQRKGGPAPPPKRPLHPGCGGTTVEAGACTPCPLLADGRTGGAQDGADRAALSEAGPGKTGARIRAGGFPPPPPPPRHTDPLAADQAAPDARGRLATPTARVYPGGGTPGTTDFRPTPDRGGAAAPPPPPPLPPPSLGTTGATLRPPRDEGAPPLPQKSRDAAGGGCGWTCTPRAPAPPAAPAGVSAAGRAHTSVPEQRADQAWGRRTAAHQNSMEAAPHMTLS